MLAVCDAAGGFVVDDGMVPFRYKAGGKVYRTRAERLTVVEGASPTTLEAALAAAPAPSPRAAARPSGSSGPSSSSGRGGGSRAGGSSGVREGARPRPVSEVIQIWTDGACSGNPGPSGSGVVYRDGTILRERAIPLGHGTNNIAELTAILEGLKMVADPATSPTDVMTDSAYCLGLLTKGWKPKKNQDLVAELRQVASAFTDLHIVKVKAHNGVPDNERADELARTGALGQRVG